MAVATSLQKPTLHGVECLESEELIPILWTREEAQQLADIGLIPERYDLIEGIFYAVRRMKPQERRVLRITYHWLASVFGMDYLLTRMPVTLSLPHENDGDLEPDITLLNRLEAEFNTSDPTAADIVMCVEIAYTSLTEDTNRKAKIYAQNEIADYWIADVKKRQIIVHREPMADGYHAIKIYTEVEEIAPLSRPDAKISVSSLFPPSETATE